LKNIIIPEFKKGEFYNGIKNGVNEINNKMEIKYVYIVDVYGLLLVSSNKVSKKNTNQEKVKCTQKLR